MSGTDRLNPLAVGSTVGPPSVQSGLGEAGVKESLWAATAGLLPFILAVSLGGVISGWGPHVFDAANFAFSLFALSLAVIIRVLTHGRGRNFLVVVVASAFFQVSYALYLSGTFDRVVVSEVEVATRANQLDQVLAADSEGGQVMVDAAELEMVHDLLVRLEREDHPASASAWVILSVTGAVSLLALFRLWSPVVVDDSR